MFNYPLTLWFERFSFGRKIQVIDATGRPVLYVNKKALALKEVVDIYAAGDQRERLYQIKTERVIDYAARYAITAPPGAMVGIVARQGMRSRWKALYDTVQDLRTYRVNLERLAAIWNVTYTLLDAEGREVGRILEEIPLLKLVGTILAEVILARPFLNPIYVITCCGKPVLYARKQAAMFSRTFTLEKQGEFSEAQEGLFLSGLAMALLIERTLGI
ncbi:MAG: hypothetical protein AB1791_16980 [Chloroflexota bacterium]